MKFGLYIRPAQTYENMLELAKHAEELGYFGVFLNDHVHGFADNGKEPYLESWTALTGVGAQTKRIRVGHITLFNSLRNPAFLAKSIATLDQMTHGRYELLIGAGWNQPEYEGYDLMGEGRGMPTPKERVDRLKEALLILRGMLTHEVFSFQGKYWTLKNAINIPQPVQKPFRISVGASKPRMIRITAKYADGINISGSFNEIKNIVSLLTPALDKNNKSIDDFLISGFNSVTFAKDEDELNQLVGETALKTSKTKEEVRKDFFMGTPEILLDKFNLLRDLGFKMMVLILRSSDLEDVKEKTSWFKDSIISQLN
jgi:alkanesulfonate monooxygenase SsuD/methylene tetrahydromethanopterin reductase-like flavin-dependent oxidoreductase (luciferase family)